MRPWFLETVAADGSRVSHAITKLPFRIGRDAHCDLVVEARGLSRQHAEFIQEAGEQLLLSDLGSTNGTWVHRERIAAPRWVGERTILHFGNAEFRLGLETQTMLAARASEDDGIRTMLVPTGGRLLSEKFIEGQEAFEDFLARGEGLSCAVQPIVRADGGAVFAYELLGRCEHPRLRQPPGRLFDIAGKLGRRGELSTLFRNHGVRAVAGRLGGARLFVNTDGDETEHEAFFESLQALRALPGAPELVIEIHESARSLEKLRVLAQRLGAMGIAFAIDDFGHDEGVDHLSILGEVPPQYVKFDMGLIRGIDQAAEPRRRLLRSLVRLVRDLDAVALAEGVETEAEAAACRDMGFELLQGYLTGRPVPGSALPPAAQA
ncbi:MAG: EAL domain-containing protein [Betaproteobacteria bacterium]|jgi:EAL domain-containing protein (putative c-di-GMP-specific phosphodiesterase class I)